MKSIVKKRDRRPTPKKPVETHLGKRQKAATG